MDMKPILISLYDQKERISRAIVALEGIKNGPVRVISPEARQRISDAQKARWAKQRKQQVTVALKRKAA